MGTYFERLSGTVKDLLTDKLAFETEHFTQRVLEMKIVKLRTMYAAVERITKATGDREVFAAVFSLHYAPREYWNFGYKPMDESMGPYQSECPKSILDLLTPTDSEYALAWRERCYSNLNKPKPIEVLVDGVITKTYQKLKLAHQAATKLARAQREAEVILRYNPTKQAWRIYGHGGWSEVKTK